MECKKRMEFFRGTTPSIRIYQGKNIKFEDINKLILTLEQKDYHELNKEFIITDSEVDYLDMPLSEEETLAFKEGDGELQLKVLMKDGNIWSHTVHKFTVKRILNENTMGE